MQDKEQEQTDSLLPDEVEDKEEDLINSVFGCCHLYRECSDQKRCLCEDKARASKCAYRKNLEAGNIFYGKNANGFNEARYQDYESRIDTLSNDGRKVFDKLITEFCGLRRGAVSLVVRNEHIDELAQVGLFEFRRAGEYLVSKCPYKTLQKRLEEAVLPDVFDSYREAKAKHKEENKGPGVEKLFFRMWMNGPGVEYRDKIAEPYRLASVRPEASAYIEELWQRRYLPVWRHQYWWLTPLAVDGLL